MNLDERLQAQCQRRVIDQGIIQVTQFCATTLQNWGVDTGTPQVTMMLFHLAMALGRIRRGYKVLPLQAEFFAEIEQAPQFEAVMAVHQQLLAAIPFAVPMSEQTHFIANIYALALEQPVLLQGACGVEISTP